MKFFQGKNLLFLLATAWYQHSLVCGTPVGHSIQDSDAPRNDHRLGFPVSFLPPVKHDAPSRPGKRGLHGSDDDQALVEVRASPPQSPVWVPIANTVNPGIAPGRGDDPRPMQTYQTLGQKQVALYDAAIKANKPDAITVASVAALKGHGANEAFVDMSKLPDSYVVQPKKNIDFRNDVTLKKMLNFEASDIGYQIDKQVQLKSVSVSNKATREVINTAYFHPNGEFIVWEHAFKQANNVANAIPLNELGMQSFIQAVGAANTKNLKVAFLANIQNKEFWAITRQTYNEQKKPFDQMLSFNRGTAEFTRFMGSPNLASKFFGFANHHRAINNRVPTKIVIMPKQVETKGTDPKVPIGQLWAALVFH